jgi:hypothetical protein
MFEALFSSFSDRMVSFLKTAEGIEAVRGTIADVPVDEMYARLQERAERLYSDFRSDFSRTAKEIELKFEAEFATTIDRVTKKAGTKLSVELDKQLEGMESRFAGIVNSILEDRAHLFVIQAVESFVRKNPIGSGRWSNRELAHANGISIREVKRWKRAGKRLAEPD